MSAEAGDKIIDSRDLEERLRELEAIERSLDPAQDPEASGDGSLFEDELEELDALRELRDANGLGEWYDGATLILEDHFEDFARELAEEIGAIDSDAHWPANCIDWDRAARELRADYSSVEFGGYTYLVRS